MPSPKHTRGFLPALAAAALAAGGTAAVYNAAPAGPNVPAVLAPVGTMATAADARDLSGVFRTVAERVMPAVVAVEARVDAPVMNQNRQFRGRLPEGVDPEQFDPFNDPRFRRFFEQNFPGQELPESNGFRFERNQMQRRRGPVRVKSGSGVVIDPAGLILTNNHVVSGASEVTVQFENGEEYTTDDILTDADTDVAVLRLNPDDLNGKTLPSVPLGDSARTQIGDWVLAFGSPLEQRFSMTAGIVSGKSRTTGLAARENFLQHDAAMNPGNSGGPLVNLDGEIVGLNTAISSRGGGYDGIGFAVPSNDAKWVAEQLERDGRVTRAFLGVFMKELDPATAEALGVPTDAGVLVADVIDGSPAAKAGVKSGDVVTTLDGEAVTDSRQLSRLVERLEIGETVPLAVLRDGGRRTLDLVAGDLSDAPADRVTARQARPGSGRGGTLNGSVELTDFGLTLTPLTDDWRDRLGVADGVSGAVITGVGGAARAAGLRPGLIVTRIGRTELTDADELTDAAENVAADSPLLLFVYDARTDRRDLVTIEPAGE